jgi:hypothetical protein
MFNEVRCVGRLSGNALDDLARPIPHSMPVDIFTEPAPQAGEIAGSERSIE